MSKPRVAVIGAGWAGLAAAVELAGRAELTVFEAGREPGGRARRIGVRGSRLDNGQHILIGAYQECLRLMAAVGVDESRALLRLPMNWRRQGGISLSCPRLPAPWHLAAGLLTARGISWRDKARLALALQRLKGQGWRVAPDCAVAQWLTQQGQSETLIREFWRPLVLSGLNTPPEQASMRVLAAVLRDSLGADRAASDLLLPRVDLSALFPEPAWRWLAERGADLRAGRRVRGVAADSTGVSVDGERFDAAVLAVAPYHAAELTADPTLRQLTNAYRYWPIYTVYLQFEGAVRLPAPMCACSGGVGDWLFDRGALMGETGWVAAVMSAPEHLDALSQEELAALVEADVRRLDPRAGRRLDFRVLAERRATFASLVDMRRPAQPSPVQSLYLAGDWTHADYPATLEGAVRSGVAAARAVIGRL
ncbi:MULTISPECIES: hydroxysqualene dehydroxylase HpnE [Chromobacterium]|uniref:FAD-dependent oxidoreductase n=1 Tax=Chromobacterium rhizoryzae TaxID=1778675 RepID=A0AAD0RR71_9NEIS|nr:MULTISPECIES: hydroxysqualene dehydroxylase HpnE [Chromobacterium]AXT47177.1 FAD-dependent oxidoreductase [Chromobacterium rhizoryzae]QOD81005.1 FAD-dependent oxidoreductase [Chromobacterium haemolyticum]